jgi:hypothetical protein
MNSFNRWNKILGWITFAIALATYTITMEKTGSLWDCGEFLSCTFKLQVAHPPGAPFYMIVGKIFSLFAFGDPAKLAMMINLLSALSTAFCTLFFFWSAVMLMKIGFKPSEEELEGSKGKFILYSAFLASVAATFLDSMWFNALEGEVYAFSVFFMAFNVWAILRWNEDDSDKADYWLLLIGLCTGMSLGVHLLSLLIFPMITLIIYFKKFKPTLLGALLSFVISIVLIQFAMKGVLSLTSLFIGKMDLLFVNTFGLPFYSGSVVAILAIVALFYYLIKKSESKRNLFWWNESKFKMPLNTFLLFLAFLWMGYTSYFMVVIRANANTPINMNVPNNFITLRSYIDREQYGDRPLLFGPNYTELREIVDIEDKGDIYVKNAQTGKYDLVGQNRGYVYDPKVKKLLPRMGHEGDDKKSFYRMWINPKFNVVDRSNDQVINTFPQGQSEQAEAFANEQNTKGQPGQFVVKDKLGFYENIAYMIKYQIGFMYFRYLLWNTSGRTDEFQGRANNDKGRWQVGIPAIDNMLGSFFGHVELDQTNKPSFLADNKANNKFYMIPFLLCFIGLIYNYRKDRKSFAIIALLVFATGIMQVIFHNEPPVEPRERDYVYSPSFWAFLFWMPFGAYAIYSFLKGKMSQIPATYVALAILAAAPILMGTQGWDDHNRGNRTTTSDFAKNMLESCPPNAILFTYGDNDTYPLWYASEVEGIRPDVRIINTSLIEGDAYISQLRLPMNKSASVALSIPQDKIQGDNRGYLTLNPSSPFINDTLSVTDFTEFLMSEDPKAKVTYQNGKSENYLPTQHLYMDIDHAKAIASNFLISKDKQGAIPKRIYFDIPSSMTRGALIQLNVIASNLYTRPVCFASSSPSVSGLGLRNFLQSEGMMVMFTPTGSPEPNGMEAMDVERVYKAVQKYSYGKVKENDVLLDEHTLLGMNSMKQAIGNLAMQMAVRGKADTASKLLDLLYTNLPYKKMAINYADLDALQAALMAKDAKNTKLIAEELFKNTTSVLDWASNERNRKTVSPYQDEISFNLQILNNFANIMQRNGNNSFDKRIDDKMAAYENALQIQLREPRPNMNSGAGL